MLTWHREARITRRGTFDLRRAGTFAKSPQMSLPGSSPSQLRKGSSFQRSFWETPLTNGFMRRPGVPGTQPQGSSLATSLGPRTQSHMAGSEREPGPDIPAWRPPWPQPTPHLCQLGVLVSFKCTWGGRGWVGVGGFPHLEPCASSHATQSAAWPSPAAAAVQRCFTGY